MFVNKQEGNDNKDLRDNKDLQYYLDMTEGFKSSFGDFKVIQSNGFNIVDESQACPVGYKARSGEFLLSTLKAQGVKEVVYVQPRRGFAGISLSYLCKKYDMDLTLIMPASKKSSDHQRLCIEYGAKPLFLRVAAMPNANVMAQKYAKATGAYYVPLGLNHEYVVGMGVRLIHDFFKDKPHPKRMWSVISTGVLSRTLQIALPNTEFFNVAVSRNIQQGDLGRANFISYHKAFSQKSDVIPTDFDCENAYDAKGWDYLTKHGEPGDWFFNVAGEAPMTTLAEEEVDSYRDWRDLRDFEQYLNKPATLF
tara:strand:+ start:3185 stop:4108 length:924 start_codon:yes stop_codon:yes gene_type:complete